MPDDGRSRLGRGLAALMGDVGGEADDHRARAQSASRADRVSAPNPRNPRRNFSDAELDELAHRSGSAASSSRLWCGRCAALKDSFEIIAGERRWRAAQLAGLHEIPIVPLEATDSEALELAIIENVQRTDLNPLEEAGGYQALASEYQHSHDDIARIVGKSRSHVTNTLRLLKLPEPVKAYITAGKITAGAARMLVGASDPEQMAREIVERGLNVRQVEALAKSRAKEAGKPGKKRSPQECRYARARTAGVERARAHRHHRPPQQGRRVAGPLSQPRSARRRAAAAGTELNGATAEPAARLRVALALHAGYGASFAFIASASSVRCAMISASADCRRASSAASASWVIARSSRDERPGPQRRARPRSGG